MSRSYDPTASKSFQSLIPEKLEIGSSSPIKSIPEFRRPLFWWVRPPPVVPVWSPLFFWSFPACARVHSRSRVVTGLVFLQWSAYWRGNSWYRAIQKDWQSQYTGSKFVCWVIFAAGSVVGECRITGLVMDLWLSAARPARWVSLVWWP